MCSDVKIQDSSCLFQQKLKSGCLDQVATQKFDQKRVNVYHYLTARQKQNKLNSLYAVHSLFIFVINS